MKKLMNLMALVLLAMSVSSCGGSSGGGSPTPNPPNPGTSTFLNLGGITPIPLVGGAGFSTFIVVTNNSNKILTFTSAKIVSNEGVVLQTTTPTQLGYFAFQGAAILPSQASRNIPITIPANTQTGSMTVTVTYKDVLGASYVSSQIVNYSTAIPLVDGLYYSNLNTNLYKPTDQQTTLVIPMVLGQNFGHLIAYTNMPGAKTTSDLAGVTTTLNCDSISFTKDSQCNVVVTSKNISTLDQVILNTHVVDTTVSPLLRANTATVSPQGSTGNTTIPVTITQNNIGNLISSIVPGLSVNVGGGAQIVTLLNTGGGNITGIAVTGNSPITVSANGCGTLVAGANCTFNVAVAAGAVQTSGTASVNVTGTIIATPSNMAFFYPFNVSYIMPGAPGLTLSTTGNFTNVTVGATSTMALLITNTSTATAMTLKGFSGLPTDFSINGCGSGTILQPSEACTATISYLPTAPASTSSFNLVVNAQYQDPNGSGTLNINPYVGISYSAVNGIGYIQIIPNINSFAIKADGVDTASYTYRAINSGAQNATYTAATLSPSVFGASLGSNTCTGGTLAPNASCTFAITYGPISNPANISTNASNVAYVPFTTAGVSASATSYQTYNSSVAALISIASVVVTNSYTGTYPTFSFYNYPTNVITASITYQNTGLNDATAFNVALNNVAAGFYRTGGTCTGYGTTTQTLASGASCTMGISATDPSLGTALGIYGSGANLTLNLPGWSYYESNSSTGVNSVSNPSYNGQTALTITPTVPYTITASAVVTNVGSASQARGITLNFTATASSATGYLPTIRVGIPASGGGSAIYIPTGNQASCVFNTGGNGGTCSVIASAVAASYTQPASYPYFIGASAAGSASGAAKVISFSL